MSLREQKYVIVDERLNTELEIARWLWAFEDTRQSTTAELEGVSSSMLDWSPPNEASSIGTILYHVALIEADWLYTEVLEQEYPPEAVALFPYPHRDDRSELTQAPGLSLDQHMLRLKTVRARLLQVFQGMSLPDFRRARQLPEYDVTPEWVLHHLMQHEAEHRGQIGTLRDMAQHALART